MVNPSELVCKNSELFGNPAEWAFVSPFIKTDYTSAVARSDCKQRTRCDERIRSVRENKDD